MNKSLRNASSIAVSATLLLLLSACQNLPTNKHTASATIEPTSAAGDFKPHGTVNFTQIGDKVLVNANISGLEPNSEHGFHVHAVADCSGDGTKAGGHFNPDNHAHGYPGQDQRHAGAMFNLKANANGVAKLQQTLDTVTLTEGKYDIVGLPLIIHRDADDYKSQPVGNAGPRIGCGIIK
ncbi:MULTISPECIES: superoxide dismutase family protein [Methylotenera]|uniref:superoxide dismutase family protein n=1 Tax=Methylotenera TaxID=359407 RepID=UPI00036F9E86|nr:MULTISPECIES: superoxide dismutase family protein [Methylotenera]